jgi:hypothetical protein
MKAPPPTGVEPAEGAGPQAVRPGLRGLIRSHVEAITGDFDLSVADDDTRLLIAIGVVAVAAFCYARRTTRYGYASPTRSGRTSPR